MRTPIESWNSELGALLLKREDLNPSGSHKDRLAEHQVRFHQDAGALALLLSSSGNGAVAVSAEGQRRGIPVYAFLAERTPQSKVAKVLQAGGTAILSPKAKNMARVLAKMFGQPNLRPSTCPAAIDGYRSLGAELSTHWRDGAGFDSVFIFSSSGSSLIALCEEANTLTNGPEIHPVQAGKDCPIASGFGDDSRRGSAPRTGSLCANETPRAERARDLVTELGGRGWIVSDQEVDAAQAALAFGPGPFAREAAAAVSAAGRALKQGRVERPLIVITGAAVPNEDPWPRAEAGPVWLADYAAGRAFFLEEEQKWQR